MQTWAGRLVIRGMTRVWCLVAGYLYGNVSFVFFFFFFKQKTAYEIGTGDWSSDVCSSDLINLF